MFSTPSRRRNADNKDRAFTSSPLGSARSGRRAQTSNLRRGLFEDGTWMCDCQPRLPALYLQVKKDGPNKSKWFYTCQNRECGFFLFAQDAKIREEGALMKHNCRSESGITTSVGKQTAPEPTIRGHVAEVEPPPPYTSLADEERRSSRLPSKNAVTRQTQSSAARCGSILPGRTRRSSGTDYSELGSDTDEEWELASLADRHEREHAERLARTPSPSAQVVGRTLPTQNLPDSIEPISYSPALDHVRLQTPENIALGTPSSKRKRCVTTAVSDDEFDEAFDSDAERIIMKIADASASKAAAHFSQRRDPFETPSKPRTAVEMGEGAYLTPQTLDAEHRLTKSMTPNFEGNGLPSVKRHKNVLFPPTGDPKIRHDDDEEATHTLMPEMPHTPTLQDHCDPLGVSLADHPHIAPPSSPSPSKPSKVDHLLIADKAVAMLDNTTLDQSRLSTLRILLQRHKRVAQGAVRGRDVARAALEERDRQIADLQLRIRILENERSMDKAKLREMSADSLQLSQEQDQ